MRAVIDATKLRDATKAVSRVVDSGGRIPVLAHLKLTAASNRVCIVATDLDISIETAVEAVVETTGTVIVPGARLSGLLVGLSGNITIESDEKRITLRCGRSGFKLPTLSVDDFPAFAALHDPTHTAVWPLNAADVHKLFAVAAVAACTDGTRFYLAGLNLCEGDSRLHGVASDGHKLICVATDIAYGDKEFAFDDKYRRRSIIVPSPACSLIARLFKGGAVISSDGRRLTAVGGDTTVTFKLIDATYSDWRRIVQPPGANTATVDSAELVTVLQRCAAIAHEPRRDPEKPKAVPCTVVSWDATKSDEIHFALSRSDADIDDVIAATRVAGQIKFGINPNFLASIVGAFGRNRVTMSIHDNRSPVRVDTPGAFGLVAVMQI